MVWWLASSAPHREAGDGLEVAPTGLEGLLDEAVTSPGEAWSPPASAGASGPHPAHGRGKLAMGSKANPSRVGEIGVQGVRQNRRQIYAAASQPRAIPGLEKIPKPARTEYSRRCQGVDVPHAPLQFSPVARPLRSSLLNIPPGTRFRTWSARSCLHDAVR